MWIKYKTYIKGNIFLINVSIFQLSPISLLKLQQLIPINLNLCLKINIPYILMFCQVKVCIELYMKYNYGWHIKAFQLDCNK